MSIDETLSANRIGYAKGTTWLKQLISPFEFDSCIVSSATGYSIYKWDDFSSETEDGIIYISSSKKSDGQWVLQQSLGDNYNVNSVSDLSSYPAFSGASIIVNDSDRGGLFKAVNGGTVNNGTIFASATSGWTWQRVFEGPLKSKWFGTVADGVTDDRNALRLALLAADGGQLLLPGGVILMGSQISETIESIELIGDNTTIKSSAEINGPMILITSCSKFLCKNIVFDGNSNETLLGVRINNVENLSSQYAIVDNCEFKNFVTSNGASTPYGCLFYGSFKKVTVLNSSFTNIKNTAESGSRIAKGVVCASASSAQGTSHFYVNNCDFSEITPIQDADAIHHAWPDGNQNASFIVENCNFYDIAKRCVKSQILGQTIVKNCKAGNENVESLHCVDLQYGGGVISDFTFVCNSSANAPDSLFKFDRFSDITDGVILSNIKVIGSANYTGYICDVQPENGEGFIDFVNVDNVISSVSVSKFAKYRANSNAVDASQVYEINFSNIKLKNLTGEFLGLFRGTVIPGYEGPTFNTLVNVSMTNVANLGSTQKFYNSGVSDNPLLNGLNILKWENVRGIIFEDSYAVSQIGNTRHTVANSLSYKLSGPNNTLTSATNELKYTDISSAEITFDASSDVSTVNDTITATDHPFATGDQVVAYDNSNTLPTGISEYVRYYVESVDANTIKLYTNSGLTSAVDITAAGSGNCKILQLSNIFKITLQSGFSGSDTRGHASSAFVKWQFNRHTSVSGVYVSEDWLSVIRFGSTPSYEINKINEVKNFSAGFVEPKWVFDSVAASLCFPSGPPNYSGIQFYVDFLSGLSGQSNLFRSIGVFTWLI